MVQGKQEGTIKLDIVVIYSLGDAARSEKWRKESQRGRKAGGKERFETVEKIMLLANKVPSKKMYTIVEIEAMYTFSFYVYGRFNFGVIASYEASLLRNQCGSVVTTNSAKITSFLPLQFSLPKHNNQPKNSIKTISDE